MAGGKETPRQKLIGMMYLVLLALLALQVSSAIIQKFQVFNSSLELANDISHQRNDEMIRRIEAQVEKAKNTPSDVEVLNRAKAIRAKTRAMQKYLIELKTKLIEETGGVDENGNFIGAKEEEKVAVIMLGPGGSKTGEGYKLKTELNGFVGYINENLMEAKIERSYDNLAFDGKEDPLFKNDPDQKSKDFVQLNFESTPLVAALAVISEKESQIMAMETQVLSILGDKVGDLNIPIDKVRPVVMSQSKMVVAGTEYNADMFMAAYASSYKPKMTFQGNGIEVDNQGSGNIKFRAQGGGYVDGLAKRTWKGTITYPKAGGGDSTYTVEQEYYVVQPVIQTQSTSVSSLYKKCGNEMTINVPALGAQYKPSFTATGADIQLTETRGKIKVIPSSPNVKIKVSSDGTYIGDLDYRVILIPTPDIFVTVGQNRKPNPIQGDTKRDLRNLKLHIKPDAEFASTNPRDARYYATRWTLKLIRSNRIQPGTEVVAHGPTADLMPILRAVESGDRILIEVEKVQRKNFMDEKEDVNIPATVFQIQVR